MIHDVIVKGIFTFYAPNTFTPNEDRVNDVFIPLGVGWDLEKYELNIFDRWGNNCFNTKDAGKGWDGKVNNGNEPAQIDTYTWKVNLTDVFGKNHKYIGRISIIK
jgi:gliding motility-associated-like protein